MLDNAGVTPPPNSTMENANPGGGEPAPGGETPPASNAPARPDWLPEKFFDAKAGAPNVEALAKSYAELEKARGTWKEQAKADTIKELFGNRPESADKYEIRVPSKAPEGVVILDKAPGPDFQYEPGKSYAIPNPADPLFQIGRELAFEAGKSQEQFDEMVGRVLAGQAIRIPTAEEAAKQRQAIYDGLGENGEKRVAHMWGWLKSTIGEEKARALDGMASTPDGLAALEELMNKAGGSRFSPNGAGQAAGALTEAEIRAEMRKPEYVSGDPAAHERVRGMWKALYPDQPGAGIAAPFARR